MAKNNEANKNYEAWRKQRKDWGDIKPITKVIPNKKRGLKEKYPKRNIERNYD